MKNDLKPCPFCGGKAAFHNCAELENETLKAVLNSKIGVHCKHCKVATQPFENEQIAREAWNRRANDETYI